MPAAALPTDGHSALAKVAAFPAPAKVTVTKAMPDAPAALLPPQFLLSEKLMNCNARHSPLS
eukprot:1157305-Pelagomonas_calceolata.AAC.3